MPKYDYIEIGTSDFDTYIQEHMWNGSKNTGLSVEPLKAYIDLLPKNDVLLKCCAAISDRNGSLQVYYVDPADIEFHQLPHWVRGCNSIDAPHPTVVRLLAERGLGHLIRRDQACVKDIPTLFREYAVEGVGVLKIDTSGHDCVVLKNYIQHCVENPYLFAKKIKFETDVLSSKQDQQQVIAMLVSHGYQVYSQSNDTILMRTAPELYPDRRLVLVYSDMNWAVGTTFKSIERYLTDEFQFILYDWTFITTDEMKLVISEIKYDVFFTNTYCIPIFTGIRNTLFICHGYPDLVDVKSFPEDAHYGITSATIKCKLPPLPLWLMPNGVELDDYAGPPRKNFALRRIGWCGGPYVPTKRIDWFHHIAVQAGLFPMFALQIPQEKMADWYRSIDMLIVTSGPEEWCETGPLPPFEAIAAGTPVITTMVGNAQHLPGPKFSSIVEAVAILLELKQNPAALEALAAEQYACVKANWSYRTLSEKWRTAFRAVCM